MAVVSFAAAAHADLLTTTNFDFFAKRYINHRVDYYDDNEVFTQPFGWVSNHGALNGGTYFDTNLQQVNPSNNVDVSWDFTDIFDAFRLRFILIFGYDSQGDAVYNYFRVVSSSPSGEGTVMLPVNIADVAFYGTTKEAQLAPDGDPTTILLLIPALVCLIRFQSRYR
jgi:hypothetical protein